MLPTAQLIHDAYGRTRVRIPAERKNAAYFSRLTDELGRIPGVREVRANPLTTSLVVFHGNDAETLGRTAEERGLFHLEIPGPPDESQAFHKSLARMDERLRRFTRGDLDLAGIAFMLLIAAAVLQLWRGNVLPAAFGLLTQAMEALDHSRAL